MWIACSSRKAFLAMSVMATPTVNWALKRLQLPWWRLGGASAWTAASSSGAVGIHSLMVGVKEWGLWKEKPPGQWWWCISLQEIGGQVTYMSGWTRWCNKRVFESRSSPLTWPLTLCGISLVPTRSQAHDVDWRRPCGHIVIGGPPCSTVARSRHRALPGGGPRPLRFRWCIWGRSDLRPHERARLEEANTLWINYLTICGGGRVRGGAWLWEHPADPGFLLSLAFGSRMRWLVLKRGRVLQGRCSINVLSVESPSNQPVSQALCMVLENLIRYTAQVLVTHIGMGHQSVRMAKAGSWLADCKHTLLNYVVSWQTVSWELFGGCMNIKLGRRQELRRGAHRPEATGAGVAILNESSAKCFSTIADW